MKEEKKLNMEKVKQVVLIGIAVILLGVGFANYEPSDNVNQQIAIVENEDMIGDVQLVSSNAVVENENLISSAIVENDNSNSSILAKNNDTIENVESSNTDNYFETTRFERDSMYSKMLESYQKILDNENLVETQKAIAVQEISNINNNQNAIMISENLIKNKGYEDAVVLVNVDVINVVVKSAFLSNEDIGKIQNIIEREFDVSLENVNISSRK